MHNKSKNRGQGSILVIGIVMITTLLYILKPGNDVHAASMSIDCGDVSGLIAAINNANDEINYPGPDTIVLNPLNEPICTYVLTAVDNATDGNNGLPSITSEITIIGNNATIERDTNSSDIFRILHVAATGTLALDSITIRGGQTEYGAVNGAGIFSQGIITIDNSTLSDNLTDEYGCGGGIFNDNALIVTNSAFSNNSAAIGTIPTGGGGICNRGMLTINNSSFNNNKGNEGGGIRNEQIAIVSDSIFNGNWAVFGGGVSNRGEMHITNTAINENTANRGGGGIYTFGTLTVTHSMINDNNVLMEGGGGIFNRNRLAVSNSVLQGNSAPDGIGGGLFNLPNSGPVTLTDCTISENTASLGGGIYGGAFDITRCTISENTASSGGGIYISGGNGEMNLSNGTISNNTATTNGGGLFNYGNTNMIQNSTFSGNAAGLEGGGIFNGEGMTMSNTIVANSSNGSDCVNYNIFNDEGYNLIEDASCISNPTSFGGDPVLGPLQDNGGATFTQALLSGSPAIDAGDCSAGTITIDQRSVSRPQGAACDIGSFEQEQITQPPDCMAATPSRDLIWPITYRFVSIDILGVTDPDGDPVTITIDSIFQDEPVPTYKPPLYKPDGRGIGTATAAVRAERAWLQNGRVYHIAFSAHDGHGGVCSGEVLVGVPIIPQYAPVDDGALYDSTIVP